MTVVPLESAVIATIKRKLVQRGAWLVKSTGVSLVGCPDLLCCYKGRFVALEVKREGNGKYGATTKQLFELDRIRRAGGIAEVVWSFEQVEVLLNAIDEELA